MAIKFSSNAIDKVLLGNTEIDKLYLGENSIYEKTPSTTETWVINNDVNAPSTAIDLDNLSFSYKVLIDDEIVEKNDGVKISIQGSGDTDVDFYWGKDTDSQNHFNKYTWTPEEEEPETEIEWSSEIDGETYYWDSEQETQLRIIVFNTAPTGDLLTWLNANATKL